MPECMTYVRGFGLIKPDCVSSIGLGVIDAHFSCQASDRTLTCSAGASTGTRSTGLAASAIHYM